VKLSDGSYSVGPIPRIGGPFDTASEFFKAWAKQAKFPYRETTIRERTPSNIVEDILISIKDFPLQLSDFAEHHCFQDGPFPLIHTDLYKSNILIDPEYCVQSVIDWEDAFVAPWEMVEFIKDLTVVPPVMDGPLYREDESVREELAERRKMLKSSSSSRRLGNWTTSSPRRLVIRILRPWLMHFGCTWMVGSGFT